MNKGKYKIVYSDDGSETTFHRNLMEKHLGKKLGDNEVVHHIDGDKNNNDINNLKVMSRKEHAQLHLMTAIKISLICPVCNITFQIFNRTYRERMKINKNKIICCSRKCASKFRKPPSRMC